MLVVATAVVVAVVVLTGGTATHHRIVFQANVGGLNQLFTIEPDGTGLKQITHLAMKRSSVPGVEQPHWSPDGKLILFDSDYAPTSEHVNSLFTVKPNGSGLKRVPLVTGLFNGEPTWSPDGKNIAYTFDATNTPAHQQGVEIAQADGAFPYALTRVEHAYQLQGRPSWSPSGNWIAFTESDGQGQSQIMKVRDVGGALIPLTPFDLNANNAKWSRDGTRLLFNSHNDKKPGVSANVYVVDADGKNLTQLTHNTGGNLDAYADSWSPDGTEIVYHLRGTRPDGSAVNQLFIDAVAGGATRQLTHLPLDMNPGYADWH